jgi:hypothetical protein
LPRVPVLRELRVSCRDATIHLAWRWAGDAPPQVRVLRSSECFCDSPDAHVTGEWGQELAYEGAGRQLVDAQADCGHDVFYSIFARRTARGPWRSPLRICVRKAGHEPPALGASAVAGATAAAFYAPGRHIDGRYVEISGDQEAPPMVGGSREWLLVAVPAATIGLLVGFLRGFDAGLLTVAALTIAAGWRLLEGVQPDLRRFLVYLRLVAVVDGVFWLAALLFSFFVASLPTTVSISGSILLFWLYPLLLLAGMAGVWLFMGRALDDGGKPKHPKPFLILAGLLALAAVLPPVACVLAGGFAVYDYRRAVQAISDQQAAHAQELRDEHRRIVREVYTPWLPADDDRPAPDG